MKLQQPGGQAKKKADKEKMKDIETDTLIIYRIAKKWSKETKICIRDGNGVLAFNDEEKKKAWKQNYERLLNVEISWQEEDLSTADPVFGPPLRITKEMVVKSISKMKNGEAYGPSGVVTEILKASFNICSELIADLTNSIVRENAMPSEWGSQFYLQCIRR